MRSATRLLPSPLDFGADALFGRARFAVAAASHAAHGSLAARAQEEGAIAPRPLRWLCRFSFSAAAGFDNASSQAAAWARFRRARHGCGRRREKAGPEPKDTFTEPPTHVTAASRVTGPRLRGYNYGFAFTPGRCLRGRMMRPCHATLPLPPCAR